MPTHIDDVASPHAPRDSTGPRVHMDGRVLRSLSALELPTVPELEDCIRCGLCLSVCPTYRPTGVEGDSPRGRVALVKAQVEGIIDPTAPVFQEHMDRCLQCMACYTVCPTGVNTGTIVARQKAHAHAVRPRTLRQKLLYYVVFKNLFPFYDRLELASVPLRLYRNSGLRALVRASGLLRRLPGPLWLMEALLPDRLGAPARGRIADVTPAHRHAGEGGPSIQPAPSVPLAPRHAPAEPPHAVPVEHDEGAATPHVAFHLCCMNDILFPDACAASVRVLARGGATVTTPKNITCCGAPHETEGEMEVGRALARQNIARYEEIGADYVVTDAAACGAAFKLYGRWLEHDPRWRARAARFSAKVRDINEFLDEAGVAPPLGALSGSPRVTYDDPCHLCHAQGVVRAPRALLNAIPDIDYVELPEAQWCCGSAGTYNITQPAMAEIILRDKVEHIRSTGADIVASANPGCMLQLEAGMRRYGVKGQVRHVVELLDEAYSNGDARKKDRR